MEFAENEVKPLAQEVDEQERFPVETVETDIETAKKNGAMALFGESGQMTLAELIPTRWLYWTIYGLSALVFLYAMVRLWRSLRDNTELA